MGVLWIIVLYLVPFGAAQCPSNCTGHGDCNGDSCFCDRLWLGEACDRNWTELTKEPFYQAYQWTFATLFLLATILSLHRLDSVRRKFVFAASSAGVTKKRGFCSSLYKGLRRGPQMRCVLLLTLFVLCRSIEYCIDPNSYANYFPPEGEAFVFNIGLLSLALAYITLIHLWISVASEAQWFDRQNTSWFLQMKRMLVWTTVIFIVLETIAIFILAVGRFEWGKLMYNAVLLIEVIYLDSKWSYFGYRLIRQMRTYMSKISPQSDASSKADGGPNNAALTNVARLLFVCSVLSVIIIITLIFGLVFRPEQRNPHHAVGLFCAYRGLELGMWFTMLMAITRSPRSSGDMSTKTGAASGNPTAPGGGSRGSKGNAVGNDSKHSKNSKRKKDPYSHDKGSQQSKGPAGALRIGSLSVQDDLSSPLTPTGTVGGSSMVADKEMFDGVDGESPRASQRGNASWPGPQQPNDLPPSGPELKPQQSSSVADAVGRGSETSIIEATGSERGSESVVANSGAAGVPASGMDMDMIMAGVDNAPEPSVVSALSSAPVAVHGHRQPKRVSVSESEQTSTIIVIHNANS